MQGATYFSIVAPSYLPKVSMTEVALELDTQAVESVKDLMNYYGVANRAEIFSKALAVLKIVAYVERTNGELFVRKGNKETKILVR